MEGGKAKQAKQSQAKKEKEAIRAAKGAHAQAAMDSALSKFDAPGAMFDAGRSVGEVAAVLLEEMHSDLGEETLAAEGRVHRWVGHQYALWCESMKQRAALHAAACR